jgi:hypothetical protein
MVICDQCGKELNSGLLSFDLSNAKTVAEVSIVREIGEPGKIIGAFCADCMRKSDGENAILFTEFKDKNDQTWSISFEATKKKGAEK